MFEFVGLRALHENMIHVGETRAVFPFEYNNKHFGCIFLVDIVPFRLYLTTLGTKPIIFELEIKRGYKTSTYINYYEDLLAYLELKYDSGHKFYPSDFFKALNNKIPNVFTNRPDYKDVLMTASNRRNIEDIKKIYFCGWYRNPVGNVVRSGNLEKTRSAFGDERANLCSDKNISSCWSSINTDENTSKLDDIYTM